MGQKVNPLGFRLGYLYSWNSRWFATRRDLYAKQLLEDQRLREYLQEQLRAAGVSKVEIERSFDKRTIIVHVARPGVAIGRGGSGIEKLRENLLAHFKITDPGKLEIKFEEIKSPDLDAHLVATNIVEQLARRMPFRRVMFQSIERVKRAGAKGVRISLSGRLGGNEHARRESLREGSLPLNTIRADIDFATVHAKIPKSGIVGVKVWIHKEEPS